MYFSRKHAKLRGSFVKFLSPHGRYANLKRSFVSNAVISVVEFVRCRSSAVGFPVHSNVKWTKSCPFKRTFGVIFTDTRSGVNVPLRWQFITSRGSMELIQLCYLIRVKLYQGVHGNCATRTAAFLSRYHRETEIRRIFERLIRIGYHYRGANDKRSGVEIR